MARGAAVPNSNLVFYPIRRGRHMLVITFFYQHCLSNLLLAWIVLTAVVEIIGYIGRALSSHESPNWTLGPYLIQTLFLLLAPALLAASVYMLLGRVILILRAESHAILSKKWLTKIFVTGDVLSFFLQGAGKSTLADISH